MLVPRLLCSAMDWCINGYRSMDSTHFSDFHAWSVIYFLIVILAPPPKKKKQLAILYSVPDETSAYPHNALRHAHTHTYEWNEYAKRIKKELICSHKPEWPLPHLRIFFSLPGFSSTALMVSCSFRPPQTKAPAHGLKQSNNDGIEILENPDISCLHHHTHKTHKADICWHYFAKSARCEHSHRLGQIAAFMSPSEHGPRTCRAVCNRLS